jgi:ATP-dependent DNA helicase RecQ
MDTLEDILKKYWGYSSFLPHQKEIIESVLSGNDTVAIIATGGGKSLCYQLPAIFFGGLTLVISPLISLMKDQVDDLNERGIPAAAYNSSLDSSERIKIETDLKNNRLRLLFISPEKCLQQNFLAFLKQYPIRLIAIDEAHCISEWGHDFRPEYRQLAVLKKEFPKIPVIALTATAIPQVRTDICQQLGLSNPREFVGSFNRENIRYRIQPKKNSLTLILNYIRQHKDDSGIVYCLSKKETEELAEEIRKWGYSAVAYHAGLAKPDRERIQDEFIHDNVHIICATIAFGMGINKPDIRYVIHYDIPKSIESYYQETGRAGRDGLAAECILFYGRFDVNRVRNLLESDGSDEHNHHLALRKLQEMVNYCETSRCRRKYLLNYFGEEYPQDNCGSCDNCDNPKEQMDGTEIAGKIIECVKQLPFHFGSDLISDVLTGSQSNKIKNYRFDKIPSYSSGKEYNKQQFRIWINELIQQGYLERTGDKYPVIRLSPTSMALLNGQYRVMLSVPETGSARSTDLAPNESLTTSDEKLFLHLKKLRKSLADQENVPPYVIFHDTSLKEMSRTKPIDVSEFRNISGVGERKLNKYGPVFTTAIQTFLEENGTDSPKEGSLTIPETDNLLEKIFEIDVEIQNLNQKIAELTVDKKRLTEHALNAGKTREGNYTLHRSIIQVRQLDLEAFKLRYPEVFLKIGSVKLSDADKLLGKDEVSRLCSLKESVTYKVVDTSPTIGID